MPSMGLSRSAGACVPSTLPWALSRKAAARSAASPRRTFTRSALSPTPHTSSHSPPICTSWVRPSCSRAKTLRTGPNTSPSRGCVDRGSVQSAVLNHLARGRVSLLMTT
eukprot:1992753-Pyramimonas_sp.AAC.1